MSHRLRHRLSFDPRAIANALHLRNPRLASPPEWSWTWPLHTPPTPPTPPLQNAWVTAIRSIAVSDDASTLTFLTNDHVALLHPSSPNPIPLTFPPNLRSPSSIEIFHFSNPSLLLAVGFRSGHVAIYAPPLTAPLFISRLSQTLVVRRLRYYPAFQIDPATVPYPAPSSNTGLFAVLGLSGTLARLPGHELHHLIAEPPTFDDRGAGWVVWNPTEQEAVLDAALVGPDPSSICELDLGTSAPHRVVLAGVNPPLVAYAISLDRAFSARDVAKRAASSVLSVAKGLFWSRSTDVQQPSTEEERQSVTGVARVSTAWADDGVSGGALISFGDVRDTARKSVSAVLSRRRYQTDTNGVAIEGRRNSLSSKDDDSNVNVFIDSIISRQRLRSAGDEILQAAKLPLNTRVMERVAAAPLPCTLVATADTLGRVFVQDSRDLCVLRVLKGYRDAEVAWLKAGGPLLVVLAPRLNVLELHQPLAEKRMIAFRLMPGSMLVQSAAHHVFCAAPDGKLYEVMRTRKGLGEGRESAAVAREMQDAMDVVPCSDSHCEGEATMTKEAQVEGCHVAGAGMADYETVGAFIEAARRGSASAAVECLQRVEQSALKVAHLMAALVTCAVQIQTEMHVILSSKAAQIVGNLGNDDLVSRFEAHGRLAQAFPLLATERDPSDQVRSQEWVSKYGRRLMDDDIVTELVQFADEGKAGHLSSAKVGGKRIRTVSEDENVVNCERFILSHALEPNADVRAKIDYVLCPRRDLSVYEQVWLARVYFSRLLEVDSADIPTEGREHSTIRDLFLALTDLIGFSEEEFTKQFVTFFLNTPLLSLLHTHASMYASPLRCTIGRLRNRFGRESVEQIVIGMCATSTRIPNAVLLIRLFVCHDRKQSSHTTESHFIEFLNRLEEVLLFRKLIAGSAIPQDVYEKLTAHRCKDIRGNAERHAVALLIEWNDFERAAQILMSLEGTSERRNLDWHTLTSVSEVALRACQRKAVSLVNDAARKVIPSSVISWILLAGVSEKQQQWEHLLSTKREPVLRQIREVLLCAHQYFSDSSEDTVRCLQLAEAMSALIELEAGERTVSRKESDDIADAQTVNCIESERQVTSKHETGASKMGTTSSDEKVKSSRHGSAAAAAIQVGLETAPATSPDAMDVVNDVSVGVNEPEIMNDDEFYDATSTLPQTTARSGIDELQR